MGWGCSRDGFQGLKDVVFIYLYICFLLRSKPAFSLAILKTDFLGDTLVQSNIDGAITPLNFFPQ